LPGGDPLGLALGTVHDKAFADGLVRAARFKDPPLSARARVPMQGRKPGSSRAKSAPELLLQAAFALGHVCHMWLKISGISRWPSNDQYTWPG
jgi:hypothetical protein